MVGSTKSPFPLSLKHEFKEKDHCHFCQKLIYPAPIGQQLCFSLQQNGRELLALFQKSFPHAFKQQSK
jgi:hypothetical protein